MSHHFNMIAYLCFTLSSFSWRSWHTAFFLLADRWGPLSSMISICSRDQSLPQSTRNPSCAYPCRRGIASWCTAYGNYGHIRISKYLPIVSLTGISVGMLSLFWKISERYFSYSSRVIAIFGSISTCVCFCCFCGVVLDSVVSSSDLRFFPTGCRFLMCWKRVTGTHPLITGNHYATTHIKTTNKVTELEKCVVRRHAPYRRVVSILRTC